MRTVRLLYTHVAQNIVYYLLVLAAASLSFSIPMYAATTVPVIGGSNWTTYLMLRSGSFQCPAQQLFPNPPVTLAPAYVDTSCLGSGVHQLYGVDGYADWFYRGLTTSHVKVDGLTDMTGPITVAAVSNDEQGTWINLLSSGAAFVFIIIHTPTGTLLWADVETFNGAHQVLVPLKPGLMYVTVDPTDGFGHSSPSPVRGFITYGLRNGGSDTVLPLQ